MGWRGNAGRVGRWLGQGMVVVLAACGGGGGGGDQSPSPKVTIAGSVSPPSSVTSAPAIQTVALTPPSNMLLPPNALPTSFPAVAQSALYSVSVSGQVVKITSVNWNPLEFAAYVRPDISVNGWPQDPTLGMPNGLNISALWGIGLSAGSTIVSIKNLGTQPAVFFEFKTPAGFGSEFAAYVAPRSAGLNPSGYTYQTYGAWNAVPSNPVVVDGYFSAGVPTTQPIALGGVATYSGEGVATYVDALSANVLDAVTTVSVQVNFVARTITFSTTGTSASAAAPVGISLPSPGLNLSGTLTYPAATNTFSGTVTSANGMSGNVTGRFYGPVLATGSSTKSAGAPTEVGGTFAVALPTLGTFQGSFGAQ